MTLSDESSKFIEVISNFHRFRHPSNLGSAFKSWIKLHSIKAATTFNNVGKLVVYTLLLMKWNGSCSVQIYAKVGNFFSTWKFVKNLMTFCCIHSRDRRDQKFRDDTDTDTLWGPESRPILILILRLSLHRDRYWYWYHEIVPGLILIPILYLIRILPKPSKKCSRL